MDERCRYCGSPIHTLEASSTGGGAMFLPITPEFEATLGPDFSYDGSEPRYLCRYIDARACPVCGAADLAAHELATYLACNGPHLPRSPLQCLACGSACRGPLTIECDGVGEPPLAYLAPKYGVPLAGRLCDSCGRVWLSLYPDDAEGRRELAAQIADGGRCGLCGLGRLRGTSVDAPYAGPAGLYDRSIPSGSYQEPTRVADLLVVVCDSCGEAEARASWSGGGPA